MPLIIMPVIPLSALFFFASLAMNTTMFSAWTELKYLKINLQLTLEQHRCVEPILFSTGML